MVFLEIDTDNPSLIKELNDYLVEPNNKVFILYYMVGCSPCAQTRPEWAKLQNVLPSNGLDNPDIIVASVNQELSSKLKVGKSPSAFPTMRFITENGKVIENYEDATFFGEKDRTIDSFVKWIKSKEQVLMQNKKRTQKKKYKTQKGGYKKRKSASQKNKRNNKSRKNNKLKK